MTSTRQIMSRRLHYIIQLMIRSVIMNIFVDNDVRDSTQIRMATLLRGLKKRMFRLFETTRGYDIDRQTDRRTR